MIISTSDNISPEPTTRKEMILAAKLGTLNRRPRNKSVARECFLQATLHKQFPTMKLVERHHSVFFWKRLGIVTHRSAAKLIAESGTSTMMAWILSLKPRIHMCTIVKLHIIAVRAQNSQVIQYLCDYCESEYRRTFSHDSDLHHVILCTYEKPLDKCFYVQRIDL